MFPWSALFNANIKYSVMFSFQKIRVPMHFQLRQEKILNSLTSQTSRKTNGYTICHSRPILKIHRIWTFLLHKKVNNYLEKPFWHWQVLKVLSKQFLFWFLLLLNKTKVAVWGSSLKNSEITLELREWKSILPTTHTLLSCMNLML